MLLNLSVKLKMNDLFQLENEKNSYFGQQNKSPIVPSIHVGSDFRYRIFLVFTVIIKNNYYGI